MLKVQFKDQHRKPFWVMEDAFSVGSGSENNLVLNDKSLENVHIRFIHQGDTFVVKTASNEALLEVNGVATQEVDLNCGDEIKIGQVELQVVDPIEATANSAAPYWSLIADSSWLSGQEFPLQALPGSKLTLGRGSQCDIVFAGTHLSRQHAEIELGHEALIIRDLGSANGTYVNNKPVDESELKAGDSLRLDVYSFRVFGPGIDLSASSTTSRFRALKNDDVSPQLSKNKKSWKTRSTSPGNRVEREDTPGKIFAWVSGALILGLLLTAVAIVIGI